VVREELKVGLKLKLRLRLKSCSDKAGKVRLGTSYKHPV
jgi:hypothetical protein